MNVIRKSPHLLGHQQPVINFTQDELNKASAAFSNAHKSPDPEQAFMTMDSKHKDVMKAFSNLNIKLNLIDLFFLAELQDSDRFYEHMDGAVDNAEGDFNVTGDDIYYYMMDYDGVNEAVQELKGGE